MKSPVYLLLLLLVLSPAFAYAASQTISVETDSSSYEKGSVITISGLITNYDESDPNEVYDITLKILAPNNNIVTIDQIKPNPGGTYSIPVNTEGASWKLNGDYTVTVNYAAQTASTTFAFTIPEVTEVVEEIIVEEVAGESTEEVLADKCGPGTHLEDGVCMLDESSESETVSTNTGSSPTEGFNSWIYSITFTLLIAFVIAILLFLISRVRGKKTV